MAKKSSSVTGKSSSKSKSSPARKSASPRRKPSNSTGLIIGYALATFVVALGAIGFLVYRLSLRRPQIAKTETVSDQGWGPGSDRAVENEAFAEAELSDSGNDKADVVTEDELESVASALATDQAPANSETGAAASSIAAGENTIELSNELIGPAETTTSAPPKMAADQPPAEEATNEPATPMATDPATPLADVPAVSPMDEPTDSEDGPLTPNQLDRFEAMLGETVRFTGVPLMTNASRTGKTRYLRFSQDWDETIMVFMLVRDVGEDLTIEKLESYVGKTVRIDGVVERQFGTNRLGVRIKAMDQIEVLEDE